MSITQQIIQTSEKLYQQLETDRDQLKVQLHLLNMEAREEWDKLEQQREKLRDKLTNMSKDSAEEAASTFKHLADEVREGYQRIKKTLQ